MNSPCKAGVVMPMKLLIAFLLGIGFILNSPTFLAIFFLRRNRTIAKQIKATIATRMMKLDRNTRMEHFRQ